MAAVPASRLADVRALALPVCVIGIDEGQFVSIDAIKGLLLLYRRVRVWLAIPSRFKKLGMAPT